MLQTIYENYKDCTKCDLCKTREQVVFGEGNPNANILIIKEAPTAAEERFGTYATTDLDFLLNLYKQCVANPRGKFTVNELRDMFLDEVYITSSIICRSTITAGDNAGNNREPKISEVKACRDRLYETIYAVDPHIILAFGKPSAVSLLKRSSKLPQKIGTPDSLFSFEIPGRLDTSVAYSCIYTHDINFAERVGDYDDPNGVISQVCTAIKTTWRIAETLQNEEKYDKY
jgi:uracil-DNA glycosylase family 4